MSFVHLHVHSQYSFLDGASSLDELLQKAASLGMPALALTDHNRLTGAIRFHDKAKALKTLRRCPAANAGYQLFRQQALVEAIAQNDTYSVVISCVAYDNRNETLIRCLRGTGIKDFTREWGSLFEGKAIFASFTHQQWVNWVRQYNTKGMWHDWLRYIRDRYGY